MSQWLIKSWKVRLDEKEGYCRGLRRYKQSGEAICSLTAYDAPSARLAEDAGW